MLNRQALTDSEMMDILSLSKNATAIYTTDDIIVETANDVMLSFWNKDKSIFGKPLGESVPELIEQSFIALLQNVWRTATTYEAKDVPFQLMIDGTLQTAWFDFEYRAVKKPNGDMYCILNTATDVTDRVRRQELQQVNEEQRQLLEQNQALNEELASTNEELSATNEELLTAQTSLHALNEMLEQRNTQRTRAFQGNDALFRLVIEQAPVAIAIFRGPQFVIEVYNDTVLEYWGRTAEQVANVPLFTALPEASGQGFEELLTNVLLTGERITLNEMPVTLTRNGNLDTTWINFTYDPLRDEDGTITGIIVVCTEVTEQVNARRQLEQSSREERTELQKDLLESQEDLSFTINAAELATWDLNPVTRKFTSNYLLRQWFGVGSDEEIYLDKAIDGIVEEDRERVAEAIENALRFESGGTYDIQYTLLNSQNPSPRTVRAKGKTLFNEKEVPVRLSGILQDITEQKRDEQRKNDFIGMVSHEMKTPLTSLSGYLQMMKMSAKSEDGFTFTMLDKANKQINRITTLINGFLNVSRLESGKIQIDKTRFDMAGLVKEIEDEIRFTVSTHHVIFAPVETTWVDADRDKIGQVITNLISNAVKYSPPKTTIHVACETQLACAMISIKDEGIGIKKGDIPKLFERYYRVNEASNIASGFGIGLYLCAEIIQRHNGKIWVDSEVGKGSTFSFNLPVI